MEFVFCKNYSSLTDVWIKGHRSLPQQGGCELIQEWFLKGDEAPYHCTKREAVNPMMASIGRPRHPIYIDKRTMDG